MEIRTHTPDSKSITLLVIRDKDGKAISYVSISGASTLVTVEKFGYTVEDATEKNAISQEMKMKVTMVRISKLETGGWLAQVIVEGEVVRSYECRTFKEAQEIE